MQNTINCRVSLILLGPDKRNTAKKIQEKIYCVINALVYFYFVQSNAHVDASRVCPSAFKSADGSAENQMIFESDDFNKLL